MSTLTLTAPRSASRSRRAASPAQRTSQPRVPARRAAPGRGCSVAESSDTGRTSSAPARLTRRGRLVVLAALTLLLFVSLGLLGRVVAGATADASGGPVTKTWVVQPGESLWDVAVAVDPSADPRETIATIVDLNELPQSAVSVGQSIQVPIR